MAETFSTPCILLNLAAEGAVPLMWGCADGVFGAAGKAPSFEKSNEYFGPYVVASWLAWLRTQAADRQCWAIENLAFLRSADARREATAFVRQLAPNAKPRDEAILIDYLKSIPGAVYRFLVLDPNAGKRTLPAAWALEGEQSVQELLAHAPVASSTGEYRVEPSGPAAAPQAPLTGAAHGRLSQPAALALAQPPSAYVSPKEIKEQTRAEQLRRAKDRMATRKKEVGQHLREASDQHRLMAADRLRIVLANQLERNAFKQAHAIVNELLLLTPNDADILETRDFIEDQIKELPEDKAGEIRRFTKHSTWVNCVAFAPDGRRGVSGSGGLLIGGEFKEGPDRSLRLWDLEKGNEIREFQGHKSIVTSVSYSPEGGRVLSGSRGGSICLWDVNTGQMIRRFDRNLKIIWCVAFSPDSRFAATASDDGMVRLWEVATGRCTRRCLGHTKGVTTVVLSTDGTLALSGSFDNTMRLWEVEVEREIRRFDGHTQSVLSVALSPDSRLALSGSADGTLRLWDVKAGVELPSFDTHGYPINSVAFSSDGRRCLTGSSDNSIRLWDVETRCELYRFETHTDDVRCVVFSPDDKRALSASRDTTVRLWQLPD